MSIGIYAQKEIIKIVKNIKHVKRRKVIVFNKNQQKIGQFPDIELF